jgi:hypothetical protein
MVRTVRILPYPVTNTLTIDMVKPLTQHGMNIAWHRLGFALLKHLVTLSVCLPDPAQRVESRKLERRFKLVIRQLEPDAHHATPTPLPRRQPQLKGHTALK